MLVHLRKILKEFEPNYKLIRTEILTRERWRGVTAPVRIHLFTVIDTWMIEWEHLIKLLIRVFENEEKFLMGKLRIV